MPPHPYPGASPVPLLCRLSRATPEPPLPCRPFRASSVPPLPCLSRAASRASPVPGGLSRATSGERGLERNSQWLGRRPSKGCARSHVKRARWAQSSRTSGPIFRIQVGRLRGMGLGGVSADGLLKPRAPSPPATGPRYTRSSLSAVGPVSNGNGSSGWQRGNESPGR